MSTVKIIDTTFRDGQQCLWATRMSTGAMLPVAETLDHAGFEAIEVVGAVQFDAAVRYLREDPWERLRLLRQRITRTPMQAVVRSGCVLGFELLPQDVNDLWIERLVANGIRQFVAFDGLHDLDNIVPSLKLAKQLGAHTVGWLTFSESPVHTDELYVAKAREYIDRADVDGVLIEDASGVLTPERVATLVPALKAAIGNRRLGVHTHGLLGLPQRTQLAAAALGVDHVYTCVPPLADANAPPSVFTTVHNLEQSGYETGVSVDRLRQMEQHLEAIAAREGFQRGKPMDFDASFFRHQIPGGVLSNLTAQLKVAGLEDRLPKVLEECGRVRAELGWPIQVTPFAQFIGVQATLNVIHGERYRIVPNEIKKYALGYYGKLLAPVEPDILDRIVSNGSGNIALERKPLEPMLPIIRKRHPNADGDELLLRLSFDDAVLEPMRSNRPDYASWTIADKPIVHLLKEIAKRPAASRVFISQGNVSVELRR